MSMLQPVATAPVTIAPSLPHAGLSAGATRHVETELQWYTVTRREIGRIVADVAESGGVAPEPGDGPPPRTALAWSDPTYHRAALIEQHRRLREMRRVVAAIEEAAARLPPSTASCSPCCTLSTGG